MFLFILLWTGFSVNLISDAQTKRKLLTRTNYGPVLGFRDSVKLLSKESNFVLTETRNVSCWFGIPFAEPPVGRLRFRPPVPKREWTKTLVANKKGPSCYHELIDYYEIDEEKVWLPVDRMDEDCLYLNIWAPTEDTGAKLPVMIWIFGGGFLTGTATLPIYNGSIITVRQNVIVVSFQYRIGMLGFLYGHTSECPGNQGIMDQYLAIKWVSENIEYFGGDRNSITLFGESSGSVSVGIHLISPKTSVFFHRAIMQSGSPIADWSVITREIAENRTQRLFRSKAFMEAVLYLIHSLNETDTVVPLFYQISEMIRRRTYNSLVDYLRRMPTRLNSSTWEYHWSNMELELYSGSVGYGLVPVIDNKFIPYNPRNPDVIYSQIRSKQLMIGFNADEGTYFNAYTSSRHRVNLSSKVPKMPRKLFGTVIEESIVTHYPTFPFRPGNLFYKTIYMMYSWSYTANHIIILHGIIYVEKNVKL